MSNKKRRNRKIVSDSSEASDQIINQPSEEAGIKNNETQSVQAAKSRGKGLFSYLKSNLLMVGIIAFLTLGVVASGLKYLDESAQQEVVRRANSKGKLNDRNKQSLLNKVNPFLSPPDPPPTPQLSKEYIYAGSRLLAVEDAEANAAPPADLAIWRPSSGQWWVMSGNGSQQVTQSWGVSGDIPVPGDYDGDGKTDFAVFRPDNPATPLVNECASSCQWYVIYSSTGSTSQFGFGSDGDKPVPADYDGDGKTDVAVFRNSNTTWYISQTSTSSTVSGAFGVSGDKPAPADYDGDGRADAAVFRASNGTFHYLQSTNFQTISTTYGASGDEPVCADYDGDGRADIALWRGGSATWYILQSSNYQTVSVQFGVGSDAPVHNDYDGDGKVDIAVWRTTGADVGKWYIRNSSNPSTTRVESWGAAGDIPVPAFWKRGA